MSNAVFKKDFDTATVTVERTFDAPKARVWEAWTTKELLEQWWAPLPYRAVTGSFDFKVGGHWHYYMLSPEGEKTWCFIGYETIDPENSFGAQDAFCDEEMNIIPNMPNMHWEVSLTEESGKTKMVVVTTLESKEALEQIVTMGFEEGFTTGLNQLEALLSN
jgi:PhnB protein